MKRFLWIAHFYPPTNEITSLRSGKIASYMPEFGWEPLIVTRRWEGEAGQLAVPDGFVARTDYQDRLGIFRGGRSSAERAAVATASADKEARSAGLRGVVRQFAARWIKEFMTIPDEYVGWQPFAVEAGRRVIAEQKPELILSTSYPFTGHLIGSQLQQESGLPWVAEYQDPWTQGPAWHGTRLRHWYETRLEKRAIGAAAALTIVTPPWVEGLRVMHGKPVALIENGYDEAEYAASPPPPTAQFTITYTGMIYADTHLQSGYVGQRDPSLLFAAVKVLLDDGTIDPARFSIRFYGPPHDRLVILPLAERYGVSAVVSHHGKVSHEEAIQRQRESTLLLLLNWHGARTTFKERGWYTGKVYEYLAARRPILAIPGHPGVDSLLAETRGGVPANTKEEAVSLLRKWYQEYNATGAVANQSVDDAVTAHTNRAIARQFATLFDEVLAVQAGQKPYIAPDVAR